MTFLQMCQSIAWIIGAVAVVAAAVVYLMSRLRRATDEQRREYIEALEDRNRQLEEEVAQLRDRVAKTEGSLGTLTDVVLRQCRSAEMDPGTGGCRWCTKGLRYGQEAKP